MNKLSYALGVSIGQQLARTGVEEIVYEDFTDGVRDALLENEFKVSPEEGNKILQKFFADVQAEKNEKDHQEALINKQRGAEYLKANKSKEGVEVTASGLQYKKIATVEEKKSPSAHSRVKCHYEGRLIDGKIFDSSYMRNEPAVFSLDQVIPGWTEGLQLMNVGEKYEFTIPADLAYGENGIPGHIPGSSVLVFTVELLEIL